MKNNGQVSEQELTEQINDKLNQLWTGMNDRRKKLVRNMTPNYSRRTDQSEIMQNQSSTNINFNANQSVDHNSHVLKMRQKLASQVSAGKCKDIEIENLKKTIVQLTNDKKILIYELQQMYGNSNSNVNQNASSSLLNESSIHHSKLQVNKNTANFQSMKKRKKNKNFSTIQQQNDKTKYSEANRGIEQEQNGQKNPPTPVEQNLQSLSKARLIQLLRSTAQYRQFIYYYDSHELSYLKRLQEQHKKNCDHVASVREKTLWAPNQIIQEMKRLNKRQKWGLTEAQTQSIISYMKGYYERNYQERLKKMKDELDGKYKKMQREAQYGIPYDLVQICKAKQRQLSKLAKRNKTNSFKS